MTRSQGVCWRMQRPHAHALRQKRVVSSQDPPMLLGSPRTNVAKSEAPHPGAKHYLSRGRAAGNNKAESIRELKRRLSDVVFKALMIDAENAANGAASVAA